MKLSTSASTKLGRMTSARPDARPAGAERDQEGVRSRSASSSPRWSTPRRRISRPRAFSETSGPSRANTGSRSTRRACGHPQYAGHREGLTLPGELIAGGNSTPAWPVVSVPTRQAWAARISLRFWRLAARGSRFHGRSVTASREARAVGHGQGSHSADDRAHRRRRRRQCGDGVRRPGDRQPRGRGTAIDDEHGDRGWRPERDRSSRREDTRLCEGSRQTRVRSGLRRPRRKVEEIEIDVDGLEPVVALPFLPSNIRKLSEVKGRNSIRSISAPARMVGCTTSG